MEQQLTFTWNAVIPRWEESFGICLVFRVLVLWFLQWHFNIKRINSTGKSLFQSLLFFFRLLFVLYASSFSVVPLEIVNLPAHICITGRSERFLNLACSFLLEEASEKLLRLKKVPVLHQCCSSCTAVRWEKLHCCGFLLLPWFCVEVLSAVVFTKHFHVVVLLDSWRGVSQLGLPRDWAAC